ncbi:TonB-dependent receptor [Alteriqipengyuania lutimaris]|uniref:TonB-dependent transporter Oar-like beta-barrel domain-containing protein n=1 Tax=Alteriqipengyuania lutimaris TaxID=1538146 RepID=A0A395LJ98_9SPHN|nr:TonB-dependent receptor [Alteriqipengyuania lutimaris]MBB3033961.1 hypothetical protein [Alteriqipengyuania lutimaris]RDS77086.1 hypothetical protein DL238_05300 [Alteriqipengyuania lutimaris]
MKLKYLLAASVVSLSAAAIAPAPLAAQQITSGIEGFVTDADGTPIVGATVTVTDTRTGQTRTLTTSNGGAFRANNLVSGGPYTITATAPNFEGQTVEDQDISISGNTQYTFELASSAGSADNVIVVSGQRANATQLAVGPGQAFGSQTLENFPSITRDVRDYIRIDPRVRLERDGETDRVSCLGANDRNNTFTVDGIVQSDTFGLSGTPFAARNSLPIPFDTIRQTSIEFAPYDVEYGQFTGCLINVVTKSGTNEFTGSAFFTYTSDDLQGSSVAGQDLAPTEFDRRRWGATLGGPIIPDRLFFFAGYEETDLGDVQEVGPLGAGFANELEFVTPEIYQQFSDILASTYGIDAGPIATTNAQSDRRFFGRLDAYITDNHRLEVTYQRLEETNIRDDDLTTSANGGPVFTGLNSFVNNGTTSDYGSVRLYSDWSDSFSTEVRLSRSEVTDLQDPVGGGEAQSANPTPRIVVGFTNPSNGEQGFLQAGPGFSRTANALFQQVDQAKLQATIRNDAHELKLGMEVNELEVFNLFAQNATGTLIFDGLDNLAAGLTTGGTNVTTLPQIGDVTDGNPANDPAGIVTAVAPGNDINNAAASFTRTIFAAYVQDDWQVTDRLNLLSGVRVEFYDGDAPGANANFQSRYGYSNRVPFSVIDPVILPRIALTYDASDFLFLSNTTLRAGFGVFAGGDPTVFFSNAFSNNGFNTGTGSSAFAGCAPIRNAQGQIDVVQNGQYTGIPGCVIAQGQTSAERGTADTQSTDPNLKAPTVQRFNAGLETTLRPFGGNGFFDNWNLRLDYIYSRFEDPFNLVDLSQTVNPAIGLNGFTIDGRPIYRAIDPTVAGCTAELVGQGGTPPTYINVNAPCFSTGRDDEIQLTNTGGYDSHVASAVLSKRFQGPITPGGSILFNLGYAFSDADDRRNFRSSTATSNFDLNAVFDLQDPVAGRSVFETRHNITAALNWREEFVDDLASSIGLFFQARAGSPYSLTFAGSGDFADSSSGSGNQLLYIPTGAGDPNISPLSNAAAVQSLVDYTSGLNCARDYAGRTIEKNTCTGDWYYDLDIRVSQEIPGPGRLFGLSNDRIELFADFDNFLNLIDEDANVLRNRDFFGLVSVADAGISGVNGGAPVDSEGRYIIGNFDPNDDEDLSIGGSLWRIQFGVRYEF